MKTFLNVFFVFYFLVGGIDALYLMVPHLEIEENRPCSSRGSERELLESKATNTRFPHASLYSRLRRLPKPAHHIINPDEDCFLVTSEEGEFFFKSPSNEPVVCGIYMIAEFNQRVQVTFNYLDVPCENGGLVAWIDGWELNGQVWPADFWDDDRVSEFCDSHPQKKLISRQNAALIQYRVPVRGKGFAVTVRHLKNPKPCNVMLFGTEGVITLRNHGMTGNCTMVAVTPAVVRILDLNVGQALKRNNALDLETGTMHNCLKRGIPDYVDIGGAHGLDSTKMEVFDSICGLDSNEAPRSSLIACEDTMMRLVSSGRYQNSVTFALSSLTLEELEDADLMCGMNEI